MGSGSYSFAAYASLASDRGYATKSADAVGLKMLLDITKSLEKTSK